MGAVDTVILCHQVAVHFLHWDNLLSFAIIADDWYSKPNVVILCPKLPSIKAYAWHELQLTRKSIRENSALAN